MGWIITDVVNMEEGNVAFHLGETESMRLMTIFINMPLTTTQHTLAQIGTPFLAMPLMSAPATHCV